jgi:pimeloyl-ACP methyl ester carboxylesterase
VLIQHTANGEADLRESGTPGVLLLDGPPGTPFVWHRVLPLLRRRGVQPGTVKRPAYPAEAGPIGDPFAAAADIAQLLDDERHEPAVIVGHSLGVGVAMALAASAPRHVRALVLVEPAPDIQSIRLTDRLLAAPILGPAVACLGFRVAGLALHLPPIRRAVLSTQVGAYAREDKALVREIAFGTLWRTFVREQRRLVGDARRRNHQLRRIDCPVVIVASDDVRAVAPRSSRALRRLVPGAEVIASTAAGYLIPIDDPECVADAVARSWHRD